MTAQAGDTFFPFGDLQPQSDQGTAAAARKRELRKILRQRRLGIGKSQRKHCERRIACQLLRRRRVRRARNIAVYLSMGSELATTILIARLLRQGRTLWAPLASRTPRLRFVPLRQDSKLRRGPFGLRQPACTRPCRDPRRMDLILLPLLGFDAQGHRLGNGGGYYDRALATQRLGRQALLLGYAYAAQELPAIPADPWDVRLDAVITEQGLQRFIRS
jgi:5-formyltetrahydrofolate cyclo-ligase